jgi:PAS domain S-box-containing protein
MKNGTGARPGGGRFGTLVGDGVGSKIARIVVPAAIVLSLLIGWLCLEGERAGLFGFELAMVLFASSNVLVFGILTWLAAAWLNRVGEALYRSEQRFKLAASSGQVWDWDIATNRVSFPVEFWKTLGYEAPQVEDTVALIERLLHPDDRDKWRKAARDHFVDHLPYDIEYRGLAKSGEYLWFNARGQAVWNEAGRATFMAGTAVDITDRKRAEERLRESEEQYRRVVDLSPDAVTIHQDGHWVFANQAAARILGVEAPAELVDRSLLDFMHPDIHERVRGRWKQLYEDKQPVEPSELKMLRPDGSIVYLETRAAPLDWRGRPAAQVVARDVTERRRAEEEIRRLNADLERRVARRTAELQNKNKELETFSYSVSHDLKAPLRGIDGYSRLLLSDYEDKLADEGRGFLRNICAAAAQMQRLIDDLLAYSRVDKRSLQESRLDLPALLESLLQERALDLKTVQLNVDISSDPIRADREGLAIVLRNLIDNAVKFSRRSTPPVVEIRSRVNGERHVFSVRDNGTGFDMKYHDRIFQIFQRLHRAEDYSGTGVGLAMVHKAVERMGGRVWAESEPGKGTTFHLDLPRDGVTGADATVSRID